MSRIRSNPPHDYASARRARAVAKAARVAAEARREQARIDALQRAREPVKIVQNGSSRHVFDRAPKLADGPYAIAVSRLVSREPVRPLLDWSPRGKGRAALFRSLADHLLAKYPMPPMLWSVFFEDLSQCLVPIATYVAAGGSFFDAIASHAFPILLTRRMCHAVLADRTSPGFLQAIRRSQVNAVGGDARLFALWMRTEKAQSVGTRAEEMFWPTVLAWLVKNPIDAGALGPLIDFIAHKRREDPSFTLSGRSLVAMTRAMTAWHRDLANAKIVHRAIFQPSGFRACTYDLSERSYDGATKKRIWRVEEILTGKELAAEGRRMGHCVYSYARSVESRTTSIWSMSFEDGLGPTGVWGMLTIEVRNEIRRVVQARGRFNRAATAAERNILLRWAGANGLAVGI